MKTGLTTAGLVAVVVLGCGGGQKTSETTPSSGAASTAQVKPYPIDWCVVSGEKLGAMGDPVSRTYEGREVKFCCKSCIKDFEKSPSRFLARLDSAATGLIQPTPSEEQGG